MTQPHAAAPAGSRPNLATDLERDHEHLQRLYAAVTAAGSDDERQQALHQLIHDASVHALAEEEVFFPAVTNLLGTRVRDHVLDTQAAVKRVLCDLDGMSVKDARFEDTIKLFGEELHLDFVEEEVMLTALVQHSDTAELARLSERYQAAKQQVTTRPHLLAPDKPSTGNYVTNRLAAPIDAARFSSSSRRGITLALVAAVAAVGVSLLVVNWRRRAGGE